MLSEAQRNKVFPLVSKAPPPIRPPQGGYYPPRLISKASTPYETPKGNYYLAAKEADLASLAKEANDRDFYIIALSKLGSEYYGTDRRMIEGKPCFDEPTGVLALLYKHAIELKHSIEIQSVPALIVTSSVKVSKSKYPIKSFKDIERIEVDGLKFTIYYGEHRSEEILPNVFNCFWRSKPTMVWGNILRLLTKESVKGKALHDVDKAFKTFYGIAERFSVHVPKLKIVIKNHGDSYRKDRRRNLEEDDQD